MRLKLLLAVPAAALLAIAPAAAQDSHAQRRADPVRLKNLDSRQYRGEPKRNAAKRDTRCRIVRRQGQDKRVCGTPTNYVRKR